MLTAPIAITVGLDVLSFRRINQDGYAANYYAVSSDGLRRYALVVKHTLPPKGGTGESHLVRLDVEHYNADTMLVRTESAWLVMKTADGLQTASSLKDLAIGLMNANRADTDAILDGVLLRES